MGNSEKFGENMLLLRKSKGFSLKELSEKTKVTPTALSNYEKGSREPTISTACAIADALGVTINDLCGYVNETKSNPPTYGEIYLLVCNLAKCTSSDLSVKDVYDGYSAQDEREVSFAFHNKKLIESIVRFIDVYKLQKNGTIDSELLDAWIDKELSKPGMRAEYDGEDDTIQPVSINAQVDDLPF